MNATGVIHHLTGLFSLLQVRTAGSYTVSYCTQHTAQRAVGVIHYLTGSFSMLQVRIVGSSTVSCCTHHTA